jgi:hypothetical protein
MNQQAAAPMQPTLARPIGNQVEAQQVIGHLSDVMDALLGVVEEETKLVRAGRLSEAARLGGKKTDLARHYLADTARLQASHPYLSKTAPSVLQVLRERHNTFRSMLQINLTVLATAHAVSEGIIRGVSAEINRKAAPQTYGASGRQTAPHPRHAQPLTLSRSL